MTLQANQVFPAPPDLNALSFARFLGTASFRQFAFEDSVELASGGLEGLFYRGRIDPLAATPEPATLLMLGTALGAIVARRRRIAGRS